MWYWTLLCIVFSSAALAEPIDVPGATLDIEWRSSFSVEEKELIRDWILYTAESASLVTGTFPQSRANILIHRARGGKSPVPWANTIRHTRPEGVSFHVDPEMGLSALKSDWTATHEFSHLLLPYPGRDDIWISEGFASYYQNILMMRKGTLTQQQGWQKIADGFGRGAKDPNQRLSLYETSRRMRDLRAYKRVYWSGALYFFEADLALRQAGTSLDDVITTFTICCREKRKRWNGRSLAAALDDAAKEQLAEPLFVPMFQRFERSRGLPDYKNALQRVGVEFIGTQVNFSENLDLKRLRGNISAPR